MVFENLSDEQLQGIEEGYICHHCSGKKCDNKFQKDEKKGCKNFTPQRNIN